MVGEKNHVLGTLRLRHEHTNEIILIPTPSTDPKDPLNWPQWYKHYVAGLSTWAILLSTFFVAGPSVAIPDMTITFFGPPVGPDPQLAYANFLHGVSKVAYFFTVSALAMGVSNVIWIPFAVKYGRRPVYIVSFVMYAATSAWCAVAGNYGSMLAARTLQGFAAGSCEVLGPLTIADIYFAHERGMMMVIYTTALSIGVGLGSIISGAVILEKTWRIIFWIGTAFTAFTALLMFFTLPESIYLRDPNTLGTNPPDNVQMRTASYAAEDSQDETKGSKDDVNATQIEKASSHEHPVLLLSQRPPAHLPPLGQVLTNIPKNHTKESVIKLVFRPLILICLPAVLWASLVMSVSIGFQVAMSTNLATAFSQTYGFTGAQSAWCYTSAVVGSLLAIYFGGKMSDLCVDFLAKKNGGIRDPEMRLPAMTLSLITGPLSCILYGVGVGKGLHWIVPVLGLGLLSFTIVQSANIVVVYMIDCYRPIAGEVTVTQYAFKSLFGFLLSFYTNTWIAQDGYVVAFGEMAAISGIIFLFLIPFYFWGKTLRIKTWHWGFIRRTVHWNEDREVGE